MRRDYLKEWADSAKALGLTDRMPLAWGGIGTQTLDDDRLESSSKREAIDSSHNH